MIREEIKKLVSNTMTTILDMDKLKKILDSYEYGISLQSDFSNNWYDCFFCIIMSKEKDKELLEKNNELFPSEIELGKYTLTVMIREKGKEWDAILEKDKDIEKLFKDFYEFIKNKKTDKLMKEGSLNTSIMLHCDNPLWETCSGFHNQQIGMIPYWILSNLYYIFHTNENETEQ